MKIHLLTILLAAIAFFSYLALVNQQAAFIFAGLFLVFYLFIYLAARTKNNVLIACILLVAIANVVGTPLFILNELSYSYSGWNAVKDFDFTTLSFLNVYSYSFPTIFLLIVCTRLIEKAIPRKMEVRKRENNPGGALTIFDFLEKNNGPVWTSLFLLLVTFTVIVAIFMYVNMIGVMGIEPERLPYKLVGILFYLRGYVLPITLFLLFTKTSQSAALMLITVAMALLVGGLSASRGVTFMYMFPVLVSALIHKITIQRIVAVIALILLGYVTTTMIREMIYADQNLSVIDLLVGLKSSQSEFYSDEGFVASLLNILNTISNRLYGAQDMVLAYQHVLIDPWNSFGSFLLMEPIIDNPAKELYGLEFLPGQAYGVGMGLIGILIMIGRADFALFAISVFFFSFLVVATNRLLTRLFAIGQSGKFNNLYYLILFIAAFNVIQAALSYIYAIVFISYLCCKVRAFVSCSKLTRRAV